MPLHIHIDPFTGAAGDMLLAALVHAGASQEGVIRAVQAIRLPGVDCIALSFEPQHHHGLNGLGVRIRVDPPHQPTHRLASELRAALFSAPIHPWVRDRSVETLDRIAEAEAAVHGIDPERVHFHEIGGVDTLVDLVGVFQAVLELGGRRVSCGPLPLGQTSVRCAHGVLPGPAPATLEILKGIPVYGIPLDLETVTPTGAALVRILCERFGPAPAMTLHGVGIGFGTARLDDRPNCLRVWVGRCPNDTTEPVVLLQTNVDDLPSEILATLIPACLAAGALDAWISPVVMKKGRPGHLVSALAPSHLADAVERVLFVESSTLGVRRSVWERRCLERSWDRVQTPWGPIRIKVARLDGDVVNQAPEFEDCRKIAREAGIPLKRVYQEVWKAIGAEDSDE